MNAYRAKPLRYPWPPMLYLTSILTAMLAGRIAELPPIPSPSPFVLPSLGFAIAMLAVTLDIWAVRTLMQRQTAVLDSGCARYLVTCGPFRFSRNPIYLGFILGVAGFALRWGDLWGWVAVVASHLVLDRLVVAKEEAYLATRFGAAYEAYRGRVRRWV